MNKRKCRLMWALLHSILNIEGCQEDENIGLDEAIKDIEPTHGPNRVGDIPHSLASVDKARRLLGYDPQFSMRDGLREAVKWYWENL